MSEKDEKEQYCDVDEDRYNEEEAWSNDHGSFDDRVFDQKSVNIDELPQPKGTIDLEEILGEGTYGRVFKATDHKTGENLAVKVLKIMCDNLTEIEEEYNALNSLGLHPNFPKLNGIFLETVDDFSKYIWFAMELCDGGSIIDIVWDLKSRNEFLEEYIISFVMKEIVSAVHYMHRHHIIHRDIKAHNILLTKDGHVKLVDFGVSIYLTNTMEKMKTCVGTPYWMAPEVITCEQGTGSYDGRCDIWSIGITAIELADGAPPLDNLQPILAMFQIVRNPPPTLSVPLRWSEVFNDFVAECLIKNPDHRPCLYELHEHPFLTDLQETDFFVMNHLQKMIKELKNPSEKEIECTIKSGYLKMGYEDPPIPIYPEDLAILDNTEDANLLNNIEERYKLNCFYTFAGDVLFFLRPGIDTKPPQQHHYEGKARSDNAPHIFSVVDSAYQDMLHHNEPQTIILMGKSRSGKTENAKLAINHLAYLGRSKRFIVESKIKAIFTVLETFGNARTIDHANSSRFINFTDICFSKSGKVTGAIIRAFMLEKDRITGNFKKEESNYHSFERIICGMKYQEKFEDCGLNLVNLKDHRYVKKFDIEVESTLKSFLDLDASFNELALNFQERESIYVIISAIVLLGELKFESCEASKTLTVSQPELLETVSKLLKVDCYKLKRVVCSIIKKNSETGSTKVASDYKLEGATLASEAMATVDAISTLLYIRLFNWVINLINSNFSFSRMVFGDSIYVSVLDPPGFINHDSNSLYELFCNITSEQLSYYFKQRMFANECVELDDEGIDGPDIEWTDNRTLMNLLLSHNNGLLSIIHSNDQVQKPLNKSLDQLEKKHKMFFSKANNEFVVNHTFALVSYDANRFAKRQVDVVPTEVIKLFQSSTDSSIKAMFTETLTKTGNLQSNVHQKKCHSGNEKRINTLSKGCKNQLTYLPSDSLHLLHTLPIISEYLLRSYPHFVFCIDPISKNGFDSNQIQENMNFFNFSNVVKLKKEGFSHRIPFQAFLGRYKFLGFDWDENVEETGENCRLLLLRLLMEDWVIGKSKVFLKYYNVEYLSRLHESQVKLIVKVQTAVRRFLAKICKDNTKKSLEEERLVEEAVAARVKEAEVIEDPDDTKTAGTHKEVIRSILIIQKYFRRWKFMNFFQIFQKYRMTLQSNLIDFCQQIHIYNQEMHGSLRVTNIAVEDQLLKPSPVGHLEALCRAIPKFNRLKMKLPVSRRFSSYIDTTPMVSDENDGSNDSKDEFEEVIPIWNSSYESLAPQMTKYIPKRKKSCEVKADCYDDRCSDYSYDGSKNDSRRPSVTFSDKVSVQAEIERKSSMRATNDCIAPRDVEANQQDYASRRKSEAMNYANKKDITSILKKSSTESCVSNYSWSRQSEPKTEDKNYGNNQSYKAKVAVEKKMAPTSESTGNLEMSAEEFQMVKSRLRKVKRNFEVVDTVPELPIAPVEETAKPRLEAALTDTSTQSGDQGPVNFRAVLRKRGPTKKKIEGSVEKPREVDTRKHSLTLKVKNNANVSESMSFDDISLRSVPNVDSPLVSYQSFESSLNVIHSSGSFRDKWKQGEDDSSATPLSMDKNSLTEFSGCKENGLKIDSSKYTYTCEEISESLSIANQSSNSYEILPGIFVVGKSSDL